MGRIQKGLAHSLQASSWVSKCPQRLGELGGYALLSELQGLQRVWATQLCPTKVMATPLLCFLIELLCSLSWDSLGAAVGLNVGLKCQGSSPQLEEHSSQVMGRSQSRSCAGFAALGPVGGSPLTAPAATVTAAVPPLPHLTATLLSFLHRGIYNNL